MWATEGHSGYKSCRHMHANTYIAEADSREDGQHEVERHRVLEFEADLTCEAVHIAVAHALIQFKYIPIQSTHLR